MKFRLAVPITLASALTLAAIVSLAPAAKAQRAGEHHDNMHASGGHIPEAPARREVHAKPEIGRRPGGRVNSVPHVHDNHWYGFSPRTHGVTHALARQARGRTAEAARRLELFQTARRE